MCLNDVRRFSRNEKLSVLNLTKLIGLLPSTLPAQIKFRYLQKKKKRTLALQKNGFYSGHVTLGNSANSFGGWKTSLGEISATGAPYDHSDRCLDGKLGSTSCKGVSTRGEMVKKNPRITDIKICNPKYYKEFVRLDHSRSSCLSAQQSCSGISLRDGLSRNPKLLKISK